MTKKHIFKAASNVFVQTIHFLKLLGVYTQIFDAAWKIAFLSLNTFFCGVNGKIEIFMEVRRTCEEHIVIFGIFWKFLNLY